MEENTGLHSSDENRKRIKEYATTFIKFSGYAILGSLSAVIFNNFHTLNPIPLKFLRVISIVFIATAVHSRMPWRDQSYGGVNSWEKIDNFLFRLLYALSIVISSFSFIVNEN